MSFDQRFTVRRAAAKTPTYFAEPVTELRRVETRAGREIALPGEWLVYEDPWQPDLISDAAFRHCYAEVPDPPSADEVAILQAVRTLRHGSGSGTFLHQTADGFYRLSFIAGEEPA